MAAGNGALARGYLGRSPEYREAWAAHGAPLTFEDAPIPIRDRCNADLAARAFGRLRGYEVDLVVGSVDVAPRDVDFHPVRASQFVLVTGADHALAGRASVAIEEAASYPFVGHSCTRYVGQLAETLFRLHGAAPEIAVEVDGWGAITHYVSAGVGIAFVPDLCLTERDRLWRIPFEGAFPPRRYGAMTRRDAQLPLSARRFLSVMVPELSCTR